MNDYPLFENMNEIQRSLHNLSIITEVDGDEFGYLKSIRGAIIEISQAKSQWQDLRCVLEFTQREVIGLRAAIKKTLDENGHLADGENCTLIELKRAIGEA